MEATLRGQGAYQFPNAIALAADETVQLYSSASETRVLEISSPLADGIEIGRLPETAHYAIVQVQERFLLWGFSDAPAQMSQAGQALFVNLLGFQGQALQLPLRLRHFTPQAGIEQALIDELVGLICKLTLN